MMAFLGLSIHGEEAFGALLLDDEVEIPAFDRLSPPDETSTSRSIAVLFRTAREILRDLNPTGVGILETSKYRGWKYREAAARVRTESTIMLAAEVEAIPCDVVTVHDAGSILGVRGSDVVRTVRDRFVPEDASYRERRAASVAAALVMRERLGPQ